MKAIVIDRLGIASIHDIPEFKLRPNYIRIKVHAIALNPTDYKHIDGAGDEGAVVGCDVAGIVSEIGSQVTKSVKLGDRVAGFSHGANMSNHEDGGFAENILLKDGAFFHIPKIMSFEEAASMPVGVGTTGQGLYMSLGLPQPGQPQKPQDSPTQILIYGGSTATGTIAIQFAALSGLEVLATASPKNHALLESLGAKKVFDYNDPDCGAEIREYTQDKLRYVFDCITNDQSAFISAQALSSTTKHGELKISALLLEAEYPRDDVTSTDTLLYNSTGEAYTKFGDDFPARPEEYEFMRDFLALSEKLIAEGKIKPHPIEIGKGFEGALEGLDRMRDGEYSALKPVYTIV